MNIFPVARRLAALCLPLAAAAESATAPWGVPIESAVSRSDIVVGQPNPLPSQAMPLGNGRLGAALWADKGLTIQLNRSDTCPAGSRPAKSSFPR